MAGMLADVGGATSLWELQGKTLASLRAHLLKEKEGVGVGYPKQLFDEAVTILVRQGLVNSAGERLLLTDKGWAQAAAMKAETGSPDEREAEPEDQGSDDVIDTTLAEPIIDYVRRDGTVIRGYLNEDFAAEVNGSPMTMPASQLLERLYRAEVNGEESSFGFWTTLRVNGVSRNAVDLIAERCGIRLPSVRGTRNQARELRARQTPSSSSGRRTRWSTILCEVIDDLGGHATAEEVFTALERRPEVELTVDWREEAMQALRIHKAPQGRCYFDVTEIGGERKLVLTENGRKLVARRVHDERAPSLSKYLVRALDPNHAKPLTKLELYVMLFLATRLGLAKDASTIYSRLPADYPDEDSYAMIPLWIEQAKQMQG